MKVDAILTADIHLRDDVPVSRTDEKWENIEGYTGVYQISNYGRVKSLERYILNNLVGRVLQKEIIMKHQSYSNEYKYVTLQIDGKRNNKSIHRLIATAFIPNPKNKPEVNHIDGNKTNNEISNLEWVTSSENKIHARDTGLVKYAKGENTANAKLTTEQVRWIRRLKGKVTNTLLAEIYGVNQSTISLIINYKKWKHII